MTITPVNTGTVPGDRTGDQLPIAFKKLNANDQDLDARLQALGVLVASIMNQPGVLTALVAALPRTKPATPGVMWVNGGLVQIS